jgi:hypothetical protein
MGQKLKMEIKNKDEQLEIMKGHNERLKVEIETMDKAQ